MDWLRSQPVVMQAFLAGLFTWGCTIVGSAIVFFFKQVSRKLLDIMMGFAAGVMIAASFWSLLAPSIEYAQSSYGKLSWLPAAIGFLVGGFFLRLIDAVVPHLHLSKDISEAESVPEHSRKKLSKTALLFLAITIHNFPEGLAVGVAFGALAANPSPEAFVGAIGLALGIGLQNVPEGAALSIPIRTDGKSRLKAFYWGFHVRDCRANRGCSGGSCCYGHDGYSTLCPILCGGSYDLRSGRGVDTGFADQWQYRCGDFGTHGGLRSHDGLGCGFGLMLT
ncbi:putative divalent heavy-metal cations transporter [Streptococcus sinensis]|uniref:Putative divalent heavy-metal cations transporter n=1 Tax=Streptococcus sinensis TaxID=176090 RepID=A0A0A0DFR5_9STRE|nr:putative divalent heavy-metal cations transporter [Streptococcus sinensis]